MFRLQKAPIVDFSNRRNFQSPVDWGITHAETKKKHSELTLFKALVPSFNIVSFESHEATMRRGIKSLSENTLADVRNIKIPCLIA